MKTATIIIVLLIILFFILFLYFLINSNGDIIKYRVIYSEDEEDSEILKEDSHHLKKQCNKVCKQEFCNEYQTQMIKYDLCKECKKENKCYDPNKGLCIPCHSGQTCESLYGCGNEPPKDPLDNYCTKCWL